MEFKLEARAKTTIDIYGSQYEVSKPRVGQIDLLNEDLKKVSNDSDKIKVMIHFIASLGIPEDVVTNLEMDHFTELCEYLASSKKK